MSSTPARGRPRAGRLVRKSTSSNRVQVEVSGYKALRDPIKIDIRPLTVLSGANSSGKSSFMQAVLLLKQTLEAQFDPGPLLLNGPNVNLTSTKQLFSHGRSKSDTARIFKIRLSRQHETVELTFERAARSGIHLSEMMFKDEENGPAILRADAGFEGDLSNVARYYASLMTNVIKEEAEDVEIKIAPFRDRCFLGLRAQAGRYNFSIPQFSVTQARRTVLEMIHVPGLRGNPERFYPRSAVGTSFPGSFGSYVASLIDSWQNSNLVQDTDRLNRLNAHLQLLGLTWKVHARPIDDATVALLVGRMPQAQQGGAHDLVNIADVGFGVSQVLPVLCALVAARPNQLVYIEQPEIHLHPRAQTTLAQILAERARRGVLVVVETHSSLLIRGIQTAVARGQVPHKAVALHWFGRTPATGATFVNSTDMDRAGRFGDWPIDFDDVATAADIEYLNAAEARLIDDGA